MNSIAWMYEEVRSLMYIIVLKKKKKEKQITGLLQKWYPACPGLCVYIRSLEKYILTVCLIRSQLSVVKYHHFFFFDTQKCNLFMEHKEKERETERKRELNYILVEDSNRSLFKVNY